MKKAILYIFIIALTFVSCHNQQEQKARVVATNSWTAAFAQTAGATDIIVLAPFEMEHPSEYELRPGDIPKISKASIIIYAGYESMVERLKKGLDIPEEKLLQIETDYRYQTIEKSVMSIAHKLGTEEIAKKNLEEIKAIISDGKNKIKEKGIDQNQVLVHYFQEPFAIELGITPSAVFGPAPPEAAEIARFAQTKATIILDNLHNPVGAPLNEVLPGSKLILLLNFPGMKQTRSLEDVIRYNTQQLVGE